MVKLQHTLTQFIGRSVSTRNIVTVRRLTFSKAPLKRSETITSGNKRLSLILVFICLKMHSNDRFRNMKKNTYNYIKLGINIYNFS